MPRMFLYKSNLKNINIYIVNCFCFMYLVLLSPASNNQRQFKPPEVDVVKITHSAGLSPRRSGERQGYI